MRIEGATSAMRSAPGRRASGVSAAFSGLVANDLPGARCSGSAPIALVGGLLAADSDHDAAHGRSRGLAHAQSLLDDLSGMQRDLALGNLTYGRLSALERKLESAERPADPRLAAIVDDIELRVLVELAKYRAESGACGEPSISV